MSKGRAVPPALSSAFSIAWDAISTSVSTVYTYFSVTVWPWMQTAMTNIATWINVAKSAWQVAWAAISTAATGARDIISNVVAEIKAFLQSAIDKVNALIELINSIPGIPDIPSVPGFAEGVQNFSGGMALVGERGPELVRLPRGADVYPNRESQQMLGGNTTTTNHTWNLTINNPRNAEDVSNGLQHALQAAGLA